MAEIFETRFKDVDGVCVKTKKFSAIFLPKYGGKLASLIDCENGKELLAQDKNEKYLPQDAQSVYVDNEVSGTDDLFPTIDMCITGFANNEEYPCHGEVLRHKHFYSIDGHVLNMSFASEKFGYIFKKQIREAENGELAVKYTIWNRTDKDFPCLFGLHCMFAAEKDGKILTFEKDDTAVIMFDEKAELGGRWDEITVSEKVFASDMYAPDGNAYKFYLSLPKTKGKCGYFYPSVNKNIVLSYSAEELPYLGIWMNNGMFKGMYSAAAEPCTLPYDSPENAGNKGKSFVIKSNEEYVVEVVFDLENV